MTSIGIRSPKLFNIYISKNINAATPTKSNMASKTPTIIENKYCLRKLLESSTWYEPSKLEKTELTPLAVRIKESTKTDESNPVRCLSLISSNICVKNP